MCTLRQRYLWVLALALGAALALGWATPAAAATITFPATGQTTCWDSFGHVISCADTGQDGDIRAGAPERYEDNGDGTITDRNTELMWEKKSNDGGDHYKDTLYTRDEAFGFIAALNTADFAGYNDWRLPNVKELLSIVNFETSLTPLDLTTFPPMVSAAFDNNCTSNASVLTGSCTGLSGTYWSSTTYAPVPVAMWAASFASGSLTNFDGGHVRAVRRPPAAIQITDCPYTISSPGQYSLAVDCEIAQGVAIVITANNVELNLRNHTLLGPRTTEIECYTGGSASGNTGISVSASNVHVHRGTVRGFDIGIALSTAHTNHVNGLIVTGNCAGILLQSSGSNTINANNLSGNFQDGVMARDLSHDNTFKDNVVTENGVGTEIVGGGFLLLDSDGNLITSNDISRNGNYGVTLISGSLDTGPGSNHNTIKSNVVNNTNQSGNPTTGIFVRKGDNNTIRDNTANDNEAGISIYTRGNVIRRNTANNYRFDLFDGNLPDCMNTWESNTFVTDNEDPPDSGPVAGCIK